MGLVRMIGLEMVAGVPIKSGAWEPPHTRSRAEIIAELAPPLSLRNVGRFGRLARVWYSNI